jgi:flagellar biosynthesis protein FlhG
VKSLSQQDYYETLEITSNASPQDVERAYHLARSTYAEGSLAGHSVFDDGDLELIRDRIEIAFRTLSDAKARRRYDAELAKRQTKVAPTTTDSDPAALAASVAPPSAAPPSPEPPEAMAFVDVDELADDEGDFDGPRLRRSRLHYGIELEEIQRVTKVNPAYLQFLEEERFEDLPAAVYVRGFVMGYAGCIGLDPKLVADSYMQRYEAVQGPPKKILFSRG